MDKASETILALTPVTFRYKKELDAEATPQFGLVAEEVEKVNSDLAVRDEQGQPFSVLGGGERDVTQRVPERTQQSCGTRSDDHETKV